MAIEFKQRTLSNGLTIIAEVDPTAVTSAAGFFVRTGARDEDSTVMGVSHFLEHMMFKGTTDISAEQLNQAFDQIGAKNNAYTSHEVTCFYASTLPEHLPRAIELLARMMRPALRQSDFDTEKGVILEEIAMYKDNPFWVLYEASIEKHFGTHPLSHRVLGTTDSITALKSEQMRSYFDTRYSADNTVVALSGKMDFDREVDRLRQLCGGWQPTRVSRDNAKPKDVGGELLLRDAKVTRGYLLAMCDAPAFNDPRRYAATLLAQTLGAPDNSLLHWSLIEPGIAEEAQASFAPHDGFGEFFIYASGDPDRLDEIWETIQGQLAKLADAVTDNDLTRLKNKVLTSATIGGERPLDRMHRLGASWTYLGRYSPLEEELDLIQRVTLAEVKETCKAFPLRATTLGRLLPAA